MERNTLIVVAAALFVAFGAGVIAVTSHLREERAADERTALLRWQAAINASQATTGTELRQTPTVTLGPCDTLSPNNANRSPVNRQLVADSLQDRARRVLRREVTVGVDNVNAIVVFDGMPNCSRALEQSVDDLGAGYASTAQTLCIANGFRTIQCRATDGTTATINLNNCACDEMRQCTCPRP